MTNEELWAKIERGFSNLTPKSQLTFEVDIVAHCNLNCKSCNHYSPLVEEEYLDINSYKKDCNHLSKLFDGEMHTIYLLGGEPLLHPQITEFVKITREAFPIGKIVIVTNGLLLPDMPESFWEVCKKCDAIIEPTYYPVKFDYDNLEKIADSKGVRYTPYNRLHVFQEKCYPICNTLTGGYSSLSTRKFVNCGHAEGCSHLKDGRMYPCPHAATAPRLIKYFNLDIHFSKKNSVDIYSVKSGDELLEKLARPIPFCQYCDVTDNRITSDWEISKKDRYEWLAFSFAEEDIQYLKSRAPVVYVFGAGWWGKRAVALLKNKGITIKSVLCTRKKEGIDNILDVPIVLLNELGEVEPNSICLVALSRTSHKEEVYPLLSEINFGDVVPVCQLT